MGTFRFGVVAGQAGDAAEWAALARRVEDLGYSTLLVPDTLGTLSPLPALAAAATVTRTLRVGSYVLAVPLRTPGTVAREAATLDLLSGGRFELGLGSGRPDVERDAQRLGVSFGSPAERLDLLAETIRTVREQLAAPETYPQAVHVPILVAAAGRRTLALAAREADIVGLALPPDSTEDRLASLVGVVREAAGGRFAELELNLNLFAVGDEPPPWLESRFGIDARRLAASGAPVVLTGTVQQMADTLRRRRDTLGISYVTVNSGFVDQLAPVIERLS